eukprot:scaffold286471_cov32-Tisochrysis_lutea.AAC.1
MRFSCKRTPKRPEAKAQSDQSTSSDQNSTVRIDQEPRSQEDTLGLSESCDRCFQHPCIAYCGGTGQPESKSQLSCFRDPIPFGSQSQAAHLCTH